MSQFPKEDLFTDFFTDDMLKELGVESEKELKYYKGSFVMDNSINKEYFSNIDIGHPKNFDTNDNLPTGGNGIISLKTIEEVKGRGPKGTSPFKKTGFDAGHILGRQLFKGTRFNTSKKNNKNIYKQTKWSNQGNHHTAKWGHNQTYFENIIVKEIYKKKKITVKYEARLIYNLNEKIPRGIHLRSLCDEEPSLNFNVFVPNVKIDEVIDYSDSDLII